MRAGWQFSDQGTEHSRDLRTAAMEVEQLLQTSRKPHLPNKCTVMVNCCPIILLIVPVAFSPFPPISREKQRQLDVPITKCF